jgi:hypothetical protein
LLSCSILVFYDYESASCYSFCSLICFANFDFDFLSLVSNILTIEFLAFFRNSFVKIYRTEKLDFGLFAAASSSSGVLSKFCNKIAVKSESKIVLPIMRRVKK